MAKGIYKITNDRTGEVYVGQAQNLESRWNRHLKELAKGQHHNSGMQKDHNRGDTFSFEILEEMPNATKADLYNKEAQYVKKYNSFREGYNQTPGGSMDQFKGRYEFGGGRLPIEKYQPTKTYLNKDIIYCTECGHKIASEDIYCSNCGEKNDKLKMEGTNQHEDTENKKSIKESIIDKFFIVIVVVILACAVLGPILLVYVNASLISLIVGIIMLIGGTLFYVINTNNNDTTMCCISMWCIFFSIALLWEFLLEIMY